MRLPLRGRQYFRKLWQRAEQYLQALSPMLRGRPRPFSMNTAGASYYLPTLAIFQMPRHLVTKAASLARLLYGRTYSAPDVLREGEGRRAGPAGTASQRRSRASTIGLELIGFSFTIPGFAIPSASRNETGAPCLGYGQCGLMCYFLLDACNLDSKWVSLKTLSIEVIQGDFGSGP